MSYHVTLPATQRSVDRSHSTYSVGTFAGGREYGPMVQITIGNEYVTLTRDQQKELRIVLDQAKEGSLHGYPGAS